MEQRLTMVTLGVADVARSRSFYEGLGFTAAKFDSSGVCFFQMGGTILGIYERQALADDAGVPNSAPTGFHGITLAWNARSEAEVDTTIAFAVSKGAKLVKAAEQVFWGGYSGYVSDPDGYLWEIAHNPVWSLDEKGVMQLPQ